MKVKSKIFILFILFLLVTSISEAQTNDTCWHQVYSVAEALKIHDSCNIFLSVDEFVRDINSTLIIDDSLSKCRNIAILGIGTNRFVKIDIDFSKFINLEEFGINGRFTKHSVSPSIGHCRNLQRVAIGFIDSSKYFFPFFLNRLGGNVRLMVRYNFDAINKKKAFKSIIKFLKRTDVKTIGISDKEGGLSSEREKPYKNGQLKKIVKIAQKKHIEISVFGVQAY